MRFTNIIKNKSKSMYLTVILTTLIVGIIIGLLNYNTDLNSEGFENAVLAANGLAESVANFFVLIKPIMNTLLNYDNINGFINFAIYIIESIAVYSILIFIMSKIYIEGAKRNNY